MPLVSVIIPVYNTEKFLPLCISSVLKQTLTDIEILLVNDGSTDGSGKICHIIHGEYSLAVPSFQRTAGENRMDKQAS